MRSVVCGVAGLRGRWDEREVGPSDPIGRACGRGYVLRPVAAGARQGAEGGRYLC